MAFGLTALLAAVDGQLGRVKANAVAPSNLDTQLPYAEWNNVVNQIIAMQSAIGLTSGLTADSIIQAFAQGWLRVVADDAARDAIPAAQRPRVVVYVQNHSGGKAGLFCWNVVGSAWIDITSNLHNGGPVTGFPYRLTTASLGTPVVTGTITGGVSVATVLGSTLGEVSDHIRIRAVDPQAGASVRIPVNLPVSPLPSRFALDLILASPVTPTNDFSAGFGFTDASGVLSWLFRHAVNVSSTTRPALTVEERTGVTLGASWSFPDIELSSGVRAKALVEKVAPFAAIPQVLIDVDAGNFKADELWVHSAAHMSVPGAGTVNAGWLGQDFVNTIITVAYPSTTAGNVDLLLLAEFSAHPKDR